MAVCHCAALICEYMKDALPSPLSGGSAVFTDVSPNLALERVAEGITAAPQARLFTVEAVIHMLEHAVRLFKKDKRFELVPKLCLL